MSEILGFDEEFYLQSKLTALQDDPAMAHINSTGQLKAAMAEAGMAPLLHYKNYGSAENINISAYFNKVEYLECKLLALRENPESAADWKGKSIAYLENVMLQTGLTPAEHYTKYGFAETRADGTLLNPSNAFDANAYFSAKLLEMQTSDPGTYKDVSVVDVVGMFQQSGIDPVSHYMQYGASESRLSGVSMVQTVPTAQRMPEDTARVTQGTLVPNNPAPPTLPPSQAAPSQVAKPGDMGGYNPDLLIPPATKPVPTPEIPGLTTPDGDTGGDSGGSTGGDTGGSTGGSTGGDSGGDSGGGTGGDSGGTGGDSGGTGGDSGGDADPNILPTKDPIAISLAHAIVTPLSTVNAGGKYSGNNQNDTVRIVDTKGLSLIEFDGGTCNDSRWQQENDTLIIDVDTNGNPNVNDGFVRIPIKNVESVVLGKGVQKVYVGDKDSDKDITRHVSFDNVEDVLLLDPVTNCTLASITTEGEGQGTLLFSAFGQTTQYSGWGADLSQVVWKGAGTLKEIVFDKFFSGDLTMRAEDLQRVGKISKDQENYS